MKTATVTDVVLWKRKRTDNEGTVSLRVSAGSTRSYKSLGVRVAEKHWDETSQRVKRTDAVDYKTINATITAKLAELAEVETLADVAPASNSFTSYCESFIAGVTSHGSRTKYQTVYNKLQAFLKLRKQQQLRFDEVTPELIRELHSYLIKSIERNTANHYMKMYGQILNRAIKERKHTYTVHPFISTEYKRTAKTRQTLSEQDIKRFKAVIVPDRLKRAQNAFLFQLLAQGMRVSDVMRLRWSNLTPDGYISYSMFKTAKPMSVFVNEKMYDILFEIASDIAPIKQHPFLVKLRKELNSDLVKVQNALLADGITCPEQLLSIDTFPEVPEVADYIHTKETLRVNLKTAVKDLAKTKYAQDFIFSFLSLSDFPTDVDSNTIGEKQYKSMHSAKIVYNRQLKEIQQLARIDTPITSHLARHAYTNLLLTDKEGYDVYDISRALGHSSLKITESYLGTFSKDHTGKINEAIAKRLDW